MEYHAILFMQKLPFIDDLYNAQVGQGVYIYILLYGLSLCSKQINRLSMGKDSHIRTYFRAVQLSQNRTYDIFFAS